MFKETGYRSKDAWKAIVEHLDFLTALALNVIEGSDDPHTQLCEDGPIEKKELIDNVAAFGRRRL
jgi:hypothetical protein